MFRGPRKWYDMHGTIEGNTIITTEGNLRNPQENDTTNNNPKRIKKNMRPSTTWQFHLFLDFSTSFQFLPKELNNYMDEKFSIQLSFFYNLLLTTINSYFT